MEENIFFKNEGPYFLDQIFENSKIRKNQKIFDVKPLDKASEKDLSFYDSIIYREFANKTKALACLTTEKLKKDLPQSTIPIVVNNVLYELCRATKKFYSKADIDYPDNTLELADETKFTNVKFGRNVLVGNNCTIGSGSIIGSNTVIEQNVIIAENSVLGSFIKLKNSIIGKSVIIQDGCKIGLKGFGFIPTNKINLKFPHIGKVVIGDNVEIGSNCTIDRGSIDDTVIGQNTYLDNQVHIAHNVKIGNNCMIAGQVGFAGSTIIGNNVSIGGQAGISGHLKIGNNVKIGGGSGVVKNVPDNSIVMGYPAVPLKEFLKTSKK
jgi:UDP-3-O-[3-hydroxymyristoyl] glucosamine N-acyltransferase